MLRTSSDSVRHDAVPKERVVAAAKQWYSDLVLAHPEVIRAGFFGSYARGDYVPGSDFDVLVELSTSDIANWRDRIGVYAPDRFPVSMNLFVYTTDELNLLRAQRDVFLTTVEPQLQWF